MAGWYDAEGPMSFADPFTSISGGPERIVVDEQPDPHFLKAPIGFTAILTPHVDDDLSMPLLWEGDDG